MKKNPLITLSYALGISMVLVNSSFAIPLEGNYWSSSIGIASQPSITYHGTLDSSFLRTEPKLGGAFETAYGYQFEDLRVEGEVLFLQNKLKKSLMRSPNFDITGTPDTGSTKLIGLMANGMYDFDTEADFSPYIGFGVGAVRITQNVNGFGDFTTTATVQPIMTVTTIAATPAVTTTSTSGSSTTTTTSTPTDTTTVVTTSTITPTGPFSPNFTPTTTTITKTEVTVMPTTPTSLSTYGTTTNNGPFPSTSETIGGSSSATGAHLQFAYQTILGVSYKIADYFKLSLDYRYLRAMPTTFTVLDAGAPEPMRGSYTNHRVMLGVCAFLD